MEQRAEHTKHEKNKGFTQSVELGIVPHGRSLFMRLKQIISRVQNSPAFSRRHSRVMPSLTAGFTLVEMLVVFAIIGILTTIIVIGGSSFRESVLIKNLAYDIALTIREAQVYGTSVRAQGGSFDQSYGVAFEQSDQPGEPITKYWLFADLDDDNRYEPSADALIREYNIGGGNSIKKFCGSVGSGATTQTVCSDNPGNPLSELHIAFKRPNPDAIITTVRQAGQTNTVSRALICVVSPQQTRNYLIIVELTGQISVTTPCP